MNDEKDDTKRRLFDLSMPVKIAEMRQELKDFKEEMHRKLDNGIVSTVNRILEKIMGLQCNVHIEKFNGFQEKLKNQDTKIKGLYWAFIIVVLVGLVLGLWMKHANAKQLKKEVSLAEGMEGYRMSMMIFNDLYGGNRGL